MVHVEVQKNSLHDKLGVRLTARQDGEVAISVLTADGLFSSHLNVLKVGMILVSVNGIPIRHKSPREVAEMLKHACGLIDIEAITKKMPPQHIIFKKTFKVKPEGFQFGAEKSFSFHGRAMNDTIAAAVQNEWNRIPRMPNANPLVLRKGKDDPHFKADMNHNFQKYHEEDAVAALFDVLAGLGWDLKFQYDSETSSDKILLGGASETKRELFIFHKIDIE